MNSLVTRLLRVPTITKGDGIAAENSAMIASRRGKSGRGTRGMSRNVKGGRGKLICSHCGKEGHLQNRCYDLIGWPDKTANISSSDIPSNERTGSQLISDEEYQEFLKFKSNNHAQSSVSPSISTACIKYPMACGSAKRGTSEIKNSNASINSATECSCISVASCSYGLQLRVSVPSKEGGLVIVGVSVNGMNLNFHKEEDSGERIILVNSEANEKSIRLVEHHDISTIEIPTRSHCMTHDTICSSPESSLAKSAGDIGLGD
ncbi:hypothetical protein CR513_45260, partial [Mucuna pruriens]